MPSGASLSPSLAAGKFHSPSKARGQAPNVTNGTAGAAASSSQASSVAPAGSNAANNNSSNSDPHNSKPAGKHGGTAARYGGTLASAQQGELEQQQNTTNLENPYAEPSREVLSTRRVSFAFAKIKSFNPVDNTDYSQEEHYDIEPLAPSSAEQRTTPINTGRDQFDGLASEDDTGFEFPTIGDAFLKNGKDGKK
jgi:hypothetical protein